MRPAGSTSSSSPRPRWTSRRSRGRGSRPLAPVPELAGIHHGRRRADRLVGRGRRDAAAARTRRPRVLLHVARIGTGEAFLLADDRRSRTPTSPAPTTRASRSPSPGAGAPRRHSSRRYHGYGAAERLAARSRTGGCVTLGGMLARRTRRSCSPEGRRLGPAEAATRASSRRRAALRRGARACSSCARTRRPAAQADARRCVRRALEHGRRGSASPREERTRGCESRRPAPARHVLALGRRWTADGRGDAARVDAARSAIAFSAEVAKVVLGQEQVVEQPAVGAARPAATCCSKACPASRRRCSRTRPRARSGCRSGALQFTPDMLPSDLTGTMSFAAVSSRSGPGRCSRTSCSPTRSTARRRRRRRRCSRRWRSGR